MFCARKQTIFIIILEVLLGLNDYNIVHCSIHTYGVKWAFSSDVLFEKLLYAKTTAVPTNYTIVYKYEATAYSPLIRYCEFNITANSTGRIELDNNVDDEHIFWYTKSHFMTAVFNVFNATDLQVGAMLGGMSLGADGDQIFRTHILGIIGGRQRIDPRSFLLIYEHNMPHTNTRHVVLGERQAGDALIDHQSKLVEKNSNHFANRNLYIEQPGWSITCVEFSFDSPSAIAFTDSKFISEDKINVIVYDLIRSKFKVDMSVYGFDRTRKPDAYQPISV